MKKTFLTLLSVFLILPSAFSQNGIKFTSGTWAEVLEEAKTQKRLIFVDAYTTWCGPCKMMDRNTYTDAGVGLYFNENFVNYKLDMERGEGLNFARTYEVSAYPTLLFINHEGMEIHREMGYRSPLEMMRAGQIANDPQKNGALLELEFEEGLQSPDRIRAYAYVLKNSQKDYREAAAKYFETIKEKDLDEPKVWEAIKEFTFDMDSREFRYVVQKKKRFARRYGKEEVEGKIFDVLKKQVLGASLMGNEKPFLTALSLADDAFEDKGKNSDRLRMTYAIGNKDWEGYALQAISYFDVYGVNEPTELLRAARHFYQYIDDISLLEQATEWVTTAHSHSPSFDSKYLMAGLLFRSDKLPEALNVAYQSKNLAEGHTNPDFAKEQVAMADQLIEEIQQADQEGS